MSVDLLFRNLNLGSYLLLFYPIVLRCCYKLVLFSLLLELFFYIHWFGIFFTGPGKICIFRTACKVMAKLASFLHHSCLRLELFRLPFCKLTHMLLACFITTFFFQSCKVLTNPRIALFFTILIDSRVWMSDQRWFVSNHVLSATDLVVLTTPFSSEISTHTWNNYVTPTCSCSIFSLNRMTSTNPALLHSTTYHIRCRREKHPLPTP